MSRIADWQILIFMGLISGFSKETKGLVNDISESSPHSGHHYRDEGTPKAASDARNIGIFTEQGLPEPLMFDHADILSDYFSARWVIKEGP